MDWPVALLVGVVVSLAYTVVVLGYSLLPISGVSVGVPLWQTVGFSGLTSLGAIGVPVVLWGRYRLRSPAAFMGVVLLFWHVLVELPPVAGGGDSPGFLFVFLLAPLYVLVYGLLAGVEYWLRVRDSRPAYQRA